MSTPQFISVIICAQDRREFLKDAVNSVVNQSLSREMYEIIVVKNFDDESIDEFLQENMVITIYTQAQYLSNKHALAIKRSKGSIICFLDDDDVFEKHKLKTVLLEFSKDDKLSFMHNGMVFTDISGTELSKSRNFTPISYDASTRDRTVIRSMLSQMASYNSSSMTISRGLALKYVDLLNKTDRETDTFWFSCALDYGAKILVIPDHLTRYRRHVSGVSRSSDPAKILKYATAAKDSTLIMEQHLAADNAKYFTNFKISEWIIKCKLFEIQDISISEKIRITITIFHYRDIAPHTDIMKLIFLTFLSTANRYWAQALYPKLYS